MFIKVTLTHKIHGQRIIYAGLYSEFLNCNIMENVTYIKAIVSGDCKLLIEGIDAKEKDEIIEQMKFENSFVNEGKLVITKKRIP